MEPKKDAERSGKKSYERCRYMARAYRQRREELGLTKEEVAKQINKPVSIVTKSENSFRIGLNEVFAIGRNVYGLDILALITEAEEYVQTVMDRQEHTDKE